MWDDSDVGLSKSIDLGLSLPSEEQRSPFWLRRFVRRSNGWLAFFVLPMVFLFGLLVLSLSHTSSVLNVTGSQPFDTSIVAKAPRLEGIDASVAFSLSKQIWPDARLSAPVETTLWGHPAFEVVTDKGTVVLTSQSGYYFVSSALGERIYAPNGEKVYGHIDLSGLSRALFGYDAASSAAYGYLTNLIGLAMIVFSLSAMYLWWSPRLRLLSRRFSNIGNS